MVVIKEGEIVSGASSYTRYNDGIEIEVDTAEEERRKTFGIDCMFGTDTKLFGGRSLSRLGCSKIRIQFDWLKN